MLCKCPSKTSSTARLDLKRLSVLVCWQVPLRHVSHTPARLVKVFFQNVLQDMKARNNQKEKFCNAHAVGKLTLTSRVCSAQKRGPTCIANMEKYNPNKAGYILVNKTGDGPKYSVMYSWLQDGSCNNQIGLHINLCFINLVDPLHACCVPGTTAKHPPRPLWEN